MLNANKIVTAEIILVYEIKQGESMLVRGKTNLKIEEIWMYKYYEIYRVKPLMLALCCICQGKKVINWEMYTLTVDNN